MIPYPKEKSWDVDPDASQTNLDRTTYGGIYVTKNLMTAYSASRRTAIKTKGNRLLVIMDIQPKSLIADEDDILYIKFYSEPVALWYYKCLKYGSEYATDIEDLNKEKEKWADHILERFEESYGVLNPKLKETLKKFLKEKGFFACIARTVSYTTDERAWHRYWDTRKIDTDDIPKLPSKQEGEAIFRSFVDKLTKTLKFIADKNPYAPKGRSLQPIRFSGSNKIICIVELIEHKNEPTKLKLHYGELPQDFIKQYRERINSETDIKNLIVP